MSMRREEDFECPICHTHGKFQFWDSVNATLDPEARDRIFSDELFSYQCPSCGKNFLMAYGFLYHDMEHKFMLFFDFQRPDDFEYKEEKVTPDLFGFEGQYLFRRVYGLNELKEKILILEHGLNDVAVERMKYMISTLKHPEITKNGHRLYFEGLQGNTDGYPRGGINFILVKNDDGDGVRLTVPMEFYYDYNLACDIDPRMKVSGLQCVDYGFMERQLRKEE